MRSLMSTICACVCVCVQVSDGKLHGLHLKI